MNKFFSVLSIAFISTILTPSAVPMHQETAQEKFDREFEQNLDRTIADYDTPPSTPAAGQALSISLVSTPDLTAMMQTEQDLYSTTWAHDAQAIERDLDAKAKADDEEKLARERKQKEEADTCKLSHEKQQEEAHKLHVCASAVDFPLMHEAKENAQADHFIAKDFVDLFQSIDPVSIKNAMLVLAIVAQKGHEKKFETGLATLNNCIFNTSLERRIPQATSARIRENLQASLAPLIKFLAEVPVTLKAVSTIEFEDATQPMIENRSHPIKQHPSCSLLLTVLCDSISRSSSGILRNLIGIAEVPTVLREAQTSCKIPLSTSGKEKEVQQQFKVYNVLQFLRTLAIPADKPVDPVTKLQAPYDHCLSVFLRKPEGMANHGPAAAAAKK